MHLTQEELLTHLKDNHITYELYQHEPLFTCEQAKACVERLNIPGASIKNLFLKDTKKNLYLIVALETTSIQLKSVGKTIAAKELRFADPDMLFQYLGVMPGSVTPLALIHDREKQVQLILDKALLDHSAIQVHPLCNDATVVVSCKDLLTFFDLHNRTYCVYDFEHHMITEQRRELS